MFAVAILDSGLLIVWDVEELVKSRVVVMGAKTSVRLHPLGRDR
jgi:hypothetical protein